MLATCASGDPGGNGGKQYHFGSVPFQVPKAWSFSHSYYSVPQFRPLVGELAYTRLKLIAYTFYHSRTLHMIAKVTS